MLIYAITFISLALVFYTIGVWSEKLQGTLKKWHLIIFWIGLVFDTLGTTAMSIIATKGFEFNLHGLTGILAILLMLFHAGWATYVMVKNNENMKSRFHKFSIVVWIIWLIPFLNGAMAHM